MLILQLARIAGVVTGPSARWPVRGMWWLQVSLLESGYGAGLLWGGYRVGSLDTSCNSDVVTTSERIDMYMIGVDPGAHGAAVLIRCERMGSVVTASVFDGIVTKSQIDFNQRIMDERIVAGH